MTQFIDTLYQKKVESAPLNKRFLDANGGPSVLRGFKLAKGTSNFKVSLLRDGNDRSQAVTPSGAKVEENTDLIDQITIAPNVASSGLPRIDHVYMVYMHGSPTARASYIVVQGTSTPPANPNATTHLLLGSVRVYPNSQVLQSQDIQSVPQGMSSIEVAGDAEIHGGIVIDGPATFNGPVTMLDGSNGGGGGGTGSNVFFESYSSSVIATQGQTDFTTPTAYVMGKNALLVYKNGVRVPKEGIVEVNATKFRLVNPCASGDKVFAQWYAALNVFNVGSHNHNDLYFQKFEVANRLPRTASDFFNGDIGRRVTHQLGHLNYTVTAVVPTEKSSSVGDITVDKRANEIVVYNSGNYRGKFDITWAIKSPIDYQPTPEELNEYNSGASDFDSTSGMYKTVKYNRNDGTLYCQSVLSNPNVDGNFTRVVVNYYNTLGTAVVRREEWQLAYDIEGRVINRVLLSVQ